MFADSSQEVISLTPVLEPFCIPSLMPFELWGDLVGRDRNYVCNSCELRELFLLRLSGGSFPSLNFLTHLPWSTLTWSLRVDPVQISSIFSLCSSLVLWPTYCSHLDLFFGFLIRGDCWALSGICLPHTIAWELSRRWCGGQRAPLICFPCLGDHCPSFPHVCILKLLFCVFCLWFCVLFSSCLGPEVNLVPVSPSWPEAEI